MNGSKPRTLLVKNIKLLATFQPGKQDIPSAAIYVVAQEIKWVGQMGDMPGEYAQADEELDLSECVVIPGIPRAL